MVYEPLYHALHIQVWIEFPTHLFLGHPPHDMMDHCSGLSQLLVYVQYKATNIRLLPWPLGISIFFALDGKFPQGTNNLLMSQTPPPPPQANKKSKCPAVGLGAVGFDWHIIQLSRLRKLGLDLQGTIFLCLSPSNRWNNMQLSFPKRGLT